MKDRVEAKKRELLANDQDFKTEEPDDDDDDDDYYIEYQWNNERFVANKHTYTHF